MSCHQAFFLCVFLPVPSFLIRIHMICQRHIYILDRSINVEHIGVHMQPGVAGSNSSELTFLPSLSSSKEILCIHVTR